MTYLDKILYLHPDASGVMYWQTHHNCCTDTSCDMVPWDNPYDGLVFDNPNFSIPSQAELDALDDAVVQTELDKRVAEGSKAARLEAAQKDMTIKAAFMVAKMSTPMLLFADFVEQLYTMEV